MSFGHFYFPISHCIAPEKSQKRRNPNTTPNTPQVIYNKKKPLLKATEKMCIDIIRKNVGYLCSLLCRFGVINLCHSILNANHLTNYMGYHWDR